jgi:hypothetical protein
LPTITLTVALALAGFATARVATSNATTTTDTTSTETATPFVTPFVVTKTRVVRERYRGATAAKWAAWYRRERQRTLRLRAQLATQRRVTLQRPNVVEAINLACATYGHCSTLWRKARCESGLASYARNPSGASGVFQFKPSTFASTPYGRLSIWSPYANALAAGWMHARGRGGEWACS